jgi:hypothetical protein
MSKLLRLLTTTLALLPACGRAAPPFPYPSPSVHGRFLYDAGRGFTLMALSPGHQILLVDAHDQSRPLPCYRARSVDPAIFAVTLPDGTVVPDAAICRPFGLADSIFGRAGHAGDTAVEIRDGAAIVDQLPLAIRDATDFQLELQGSPASDRGLALDLGSQPYELHIRVVVSERLYVSAGTAPWTLRIADPGVAVLDDGAAELTTFSPPGLYGAVTVHLRGQAVGTTTLSVTLGNLTRDYPITVAVPKS